METNLYTTTIPPMRKMLVNLTNILGKIEAHAAKFGNERRPASFYEDRLVHDHLIFDQFNFMQQVQRVSDNAKGGAARLAGVEAPAMEDTEKTIPELKERLAKTIAFLDTIKPEQVAGQDDRRITLPYWKDKEMTAAGYAAGYLMPNFYFHAVTAYAILRKNGIEVGKGDYIGEMPFVN